MPPRIATETIDVAAAIRLILVSMAEFTFYARGDSSTANNSAINTQNLSTTPVTELTFFPADGGDVLLEYNDGDIDPDTLVRVDGYETTFTVEFTGTLPTTSKWADVNGLDLRGADIMVISLVDVDGNLQRYYFVTDQILTPEDLAEFPNGAANIGNFDPQPPVVVICFASGVPVDTPGGPRPVEDLAPGDLVSTDTGPRPLRWTGERHVSRAEMERTPMLRPIEIAADAFGPGVPAQPVTVSANHRILLTGWSVELAVGSKSALTAAKHLVDGRRVRWTSPEAGVTYHHLLFDTHRLVTTSGLVSESFDPGPVGLATLTPENRAAVEAILAGRSVQDPAHATPSLRRHEARALQLG